MVCTGFVLMQAPLHALVQCLCSRVGEPGNEASADMYKILVGCILVCSLENNKIIIEL